MIIIYLLAGIISGLLAVLFGFGGGFIVVPLLFRLLPFYGVPAELVMHIAVGSSLMVMFFNMIYASWLHHLQQNIDFSLLQKMLPFIILGAIVGALIASMVDAKYLKYAFLILMICVLLRTLKREFFKVDFTSTFKKPKKVVLTTLSFITGAIASSLGIGGSVIIVPFFRHYNLPMIKASALANALAIPISLIGSVILMITGFYVANLPRFSTGYIFWPAVLGIFIGSILGAKIGIRLSVAIPDRMYGKIYALLLSIVILSMLI